MNILAFPQAKEFIDDYVHYSITTVNEETWKHEKADAKGFLAEGKVPTHLLQ